MFAFGALGTGSGAAANALPPLTLAQLTRAQAGVRFTQLYRLQYLSAKSVAELLRRSFANIQVDVVTDVNSIAVVADAAQHKRIADALAQLDVPSGARAAQAAAITPLAAAPLPAAGAAAGESGVEVITLQAAVPGVNGVPSSTATDIAAAVMQALSPSLPRFAHHDLRRAIATAADREPQYDPDRARIDR